MENSKRNIIIGVIVVIIIIVAIGLGIGLGMKKTPVQTSNKQPQVNLPGTTPLTSLPDIQEGFNPTIVRVDPEDTNNVLGVEDKGYENLGSFRKGTYSNVGNDQKVYCREVGGNPRFVSCGVPGNPYKYMPPDEFGGPFSDPGYQGFRSMFKIDGTGDNRLNGKIVFCKGTLGDNPTNPRMSCIGLNADLSWNYENQYMGLGKLGNALDYFTSPRISPPPPPPPSLPPGYPEE